MEEVKTSAIAPQVEVSTISQITEIVVVSTISQIITADSSSKAGTVLLDSTAEVDWAQHHAAQHSNTHLQEQPSVSYFINIYTITIIVLFRRYWWIAGL
jgi:hypothetical protein